MKKLLAAIGLTMLAASPAFATDIINQDQKAYKITILDGSVTSTKEVGSRGSIYGLCTSGPCTFTIKGAQITADKNATLVINNGQFRKM